MNATFAPSLADTLQTALKLSQAVSTHPQARSEFEQIKAQLENSSPELADLFTTLWQEYLSAQRSAAFWQELCQVEKHLAERLTESHLQLKQNYLRLMQEQ